MKNISALIVFNKPFQISQNNGKMQTMEIHVLELW
jgi:hypothetical protein